MQRKLFIGIDSNFHSKFTFKMCVTNHIDRPGIKTTLCKINNFSIAISICPKYFCTQKTVVKKFGFSELNFFFFNKHTIFHKNKLKLQQNDINIKRYTRLKFK